MAIIDFGFISIDELRAVKEESASLLPVTDAKANDQGCRPKLRGLLGRVAHMPTLISGLHMTRRIRSGRVTASSRISHANCSSTGKQWTMSESFGLAEGRIMSFGGPTEERVIWRKRFQGQIFDLRGKIVLTRFDCCELVKCTLLIDAGTEQLAFTECAFTDCNIDQLAPDEERGLYVRDNVFHRPLHERWAEFESKLAQTLAARGSKLLLTFRGYSFDC
jgi:hypothetical protein